MTDRVLAYYPEGTGTYVYGLGDLLRIIYEWLHFKHLILFVRHGLELLC